MTDVLFRPWVCRAFEEHIMLKKGKTRQKSISVLGGILGGDFAGQLRDVKVPTPCKTRGIDTLQSRVSCVLFIMCKIIYA